MAQDNELIKKIADKYGAEEEEVFSEMQKAIDAIPVDKKKEIFGEDEPDLATFLRYMISRLESEEE